MMMCDYQMFWHEHRKRPRLITSVTLGKGYTEYMAEDGSIKRHHYDAIKTIHETMKRASEAMKAESILWRAFLQ